MMHNISLQHGYVTVRPSVCPTLALMYEYDDHISIGTLKINTWSSLGPCCVRTMTSCESTRKRVSRNIRWNRPRTYKVALGIRITS